MTTPYFVQGGASPAGASRLDTFGRCPRLYAYKYRLGLYRSGSTAQGVGTLIHAALAQHYARMGAAQPGGITVDDRHFTDPDDLGTWQDAITRSDADAESQRRAGDTVAAYVDHYRRDVFRVLHVEGLYSATIPDPERGAAYPFTARVDLVTEGPDGKVYLWDHKSTVRIEGKHATAYSMSLQIVGHRWLAQQAYGERFGGYVLNMIQTTTTKFERPSLLPAPALVRAFPATVIERERRIADLAAADPLDYPAVQSELTCVHRYGACDAIERCCWGTSA
jgi:hypothetical protein